MKLVVLYLLTPGFFDSFWNMVLKKSTGIADWLYNLVGVVFLIGSIIFFKRALAFIPISICLMVWAAISNILTLLLDMAIFKTNIDIKTGIFMFFCFISMLGIIYSSN